MTRKPDWPLLLLLIAVMLGTILRFWPGIVNGFPTLDGGMFYVMSRELSAGHFILPQYTSYNHLHIPYMYPPLGFYAAALLSTLTPASDLWIFLYIPALISSIAIFFFYKFAEEILDSRISASLATLVYALSSRAFVWEVMGGGMTRSLGQLFLLLMMWQAIRFFRTIQPDSHNAAGEKSNPQTTANKHFIWVIIFGAAVVFSYLHATLHAVLGGLLIFIFYNKTRRGLISALGIATGIVLITMPWWGIVISRYGVQPFIYAAQTSKHSFDQYLTFLDLYNPLSNYFAIPALFFLYLGLWYSLKRHKYFILVWILVTYLIDPRGSETVAPLAEALLKGLGIFVFLTWINRSDNTDDNTLFISPLSRAIIFVSIFYFAISASGGVFQLINTSLKPADLEMINWVNANTDKNKNFLLVTGREFSMSDPTQEWFPALTDQHSITTLQGMEWTLGKNFFPWLEQLTAIQSCTDVNCIDTWSAQNHVEYDYLVVTIPDAANESDWAISLRSLANSTRNSNALLLIHEASNSLIFKNICCEQ